MVVLNECQENGRIHMIHVKVKECGEGRCRKKISGRRNLEVTNMIKMHGGRRLLQYDLRRTANSSTLGARCNSERYDELQLKILRTFNRSKSKLSETFVIPPSAFVSINSERGARASWAVSIEKWPQSKSSGLPDSSSGAVVFSTVPMGRS